MQLDDEQKHCKAICILEQERLGWDEAFRNCFRAFMSVLECFSVDDGKNASKDIGVEEA